MPVDFRDYQCVDSDGLFSLEGFASFLSGAAPVVGLSCMSNLLPFALLGMRAFKQEHPDRTLVLGGVGPTGVEQQILERFDWVDVIVRGEAERSAPALVRALQGRGELSCVPGISFRLNGRVVHTPKPKRITELDELPAPAYPHVDLARFRGFGVITSRGCPYRCRFCSVARMWDHHVCYRSVEAVVAEMRQLHDLAGADLFLLQDDLFVSSKERVHAFCEALRRSGLRVQWKALGRVDRVDRALMHTMAEAGCIDLRFGIESGSEGVLRAVRKGLRSERTAEVVKEACQIFPQVDLFYVWGFPFETMADFHATALQMVGFRMMGARIVPLLLSHLPQCDIGAAVTDHSQLEFAADLVPESVSSGIEMYDGFRAEIAPAQQYVFDFIQQHPDVFPGFFHRDVDTNIRPKLHILEELGFYPSPSCAPAA